MRGTFADGRADVLGHHLSVLTAADLVMAHPVQLCVAVEELEQLESCSGPPLEHLIVFVLGEKQRVHHACSMRDVATDVVKLPEESVL